MSTKLTSPHLDSHLAASRPEVAVPAPDKESAEAKAQRKAEKKALKETLKAALLDAVSKRDLIGVQKALHDGAKPYATKWAAVSKAASQGSTEIVLALLAKAATLVPAEPDAARLEEKFGLDKGLELLMRYGPEWEKKADKAREKNMLSGAAFALTAASQAGRAETVTKLLNCEYNQKTGQMQRVMYDAAYSTPARLSVLMALLTHVGPHSEDVTRGLGPALSRALSRGNIDAAKALVARGAVLRGSHECTEALIGALQLGGAEPIELIFKNGFQAPFDNGTALHWAVSLARQDVVDLLIEKKAVDTTQDSINQVTAKAVMKNPLATILQVAQLAADPCAAIAGALPIAAYHEKADVFAGLLAEYPAAAALVRKNFSITKPRSSPNVSSTFGARTWQHKMVSPTLRMLDAYERQLALVGSIEDGALAAESAPMRRSLPASSKP